MMIPFLFKRKPDTSNILKTEKQYSDMQVFSLPCHSLNARHRAEQLFVCVCACVPSCTVCIFNTKSRLVNKVCVRQCSCVLFDVFFISGSSEVAMEENRMECLDDFRFVYFPCFKHFLKGLRDSRWEPVNSWGLQNNFYQFEVFANPLCYEA